MHIKSEVARSRLSKEPAHDGCTDVTDRINVLRCCIHM